MFIKNKYYNKYRDIIRNAKLYNRVKGDVYFESHHILPKSVYPQYISNKHNLVLLTAKEHFVCHHLLTKCVEAKYKPGMTLALWRMVHAEQHSQRITAKVYGVIKEQMSTDKRNWMKAGGNPKCTFKGHKHNEKSLEKMLIASSKANTAKTKKSIERVKALLSEHNLKFVELKDNYVSVECNCGNTFEKHRQYLMPSKFDKEMCKTCYPKKPMAKEHRDKIGKAHKGKVVSEETKQKLRKYYESK